MTPRRISRVARPTRRVVKRAGSKIKVVPVSTFKQALAVLRAGGAPVKPTAPTTSTTIVA